MSKLRSCTERSLLLESEDKIQRGLFDLLQVVNNFKEMQKVRCLEFLFKC